MNAALKRLEAAPMGLTARERAFLVLRPWLAGGVSTSRCSARRTRKPFLAAVASVPTTAPHSPSV